MDITKLSIEALKALAFDLISQREQAANNLSVVLQEIEKRKNAPALTPQAPPAEKELKEAMTHSETNFGGIAT